MAPEGLPSGTVTFLFTDIEGSTALWERDPAAMREALAAHDELIRSTIARSGGTVFKSIGDAFCSVFRDPEDALSAAITAQRDLGKRSWPVQLGPIAVRMGIHTAVCAEVDGDYYGPPVNRVARLMSTAYGGQILVSEAAAGLLRDALPAAVTLRNIGLIRLKGLNRPEPAFQAVGRGIRKNFPAPRSLNSRPSNLPTQISTFVGRTAELQKLDELLARGRLLTIVGPGGIGKTRLTLQLGASVAERFVDGCWLIDLAPVRRADFIAQAAADALGLHERAAANVESTLLEHLADRTLLLILDNVEHLIGGVARLVKAILSHCPTITILATSREPMHVLGEQIFRLGALSEGKALFLERARQVAPTATFDEAADATLATLCARLENIPLAIELACARLSTMTLKGLERRLKSALSLSSKDSTESSRHRTLRDTIAWSYELLSPDERAVLRALSVFNGGCTATAIAAVTPQVDDAGEIADSLVDKSLLLAEEREGDAYYRPLEIVSEYARNELRNAREETKAEAAHAGFYASIILQLPEAKPTRPKTVLLDDEIPNVRLMLEWEFEHDRSTASRLVQALAATWRTRGTISEARSWIGRALDFPEEGLSERPRLLCLAASFATL
ncbi:MAG TPA: adenylate/guanylate cyclase domain-containing protein, partial [Candidatus Cybelea sp.]